MPGFTLSPGADAAPVAAAQADLEHDLGSAARSLVDRVLIVFGEVAANCMEHGQADVEVRWRTRGGSVELDVLGPGPDVTRIEGATLPHDESTRGRGLFLIRTLATSIASVPGGLRIRFDPD